MKTSDSCDSSTLSACFQYPAASNSSTTIQSDQEDILDAIDKFLRECSPAEVVEWTNLSELSPETTSSNQNNDIGTYDEHDNVLQLYTKKDSAQVCRRSPKEEIEILHQTISRLKAQLKSLESKKTRNSTSGKIIVSRTQEMWRRLALSQIERRRKSEANNAFLREMVQIQILEAKNLRRILRRRARIESMQEALGVKGVKKLLKATSTNNQHVFQILRHEADQLFVGMDDLFTNKEMDNLQYTGHVRTTNLEVVNGVYYEMLQKRLLPFDIHATEKAVWECLRRVGMDNLRGVGGSNALVNVHPNTTEEGGDTLQSSFFAAMSGTGDLNVTINTKVARRYKSEERTTFVCRIISEPKFESGKRGISALTTIQIILNEVGTRDEEDGTTTAMKVYFSAERSTLAAKEDPATPLAFAAWDILVPRFPSDVESVLLDAHCGFEVKLD